MCSRKGKGEVIEIKLEPHGGMRGRCSQCQQSAPSYDRLPERRWQFVPLWGIRTYFLYAPRLKATGRAVRDRCGRRFRGRYYHL
jgi:hypothetical protein